MSNFRLVDVRCSFGFQCGDLSSREEALERSIEFKNAARDDFTRTFDLWRQDREFEYPYRGLLKPSTTLSPDTFGDLDPAQVDAFASGHLQEHVLNGHRAEAVPTSISVCIKVGSDWINIGGYYVEYDGARYESSAIVDNFKTAYTANRPQLPIGFDEDCETLRTLPVVLFVSWPA